MQRPPLHAAATLCGVDFVWGLPWYSALDHAEVRRVPVASMCDGADPFRVGSTTTGLTQQALLSASRKR